MTDNCFMDAVIKRRSVYQLGKAEVVAPQDIINMVNTAVKYAPSAFNSQSARVVLLFGENYQRFWKMVAETLRQVVPEDKFAATQEKINSFLQGYGTVLFFEDTDIVEALQKKFALYRENFPLWSMQSGGMLQFVVWTALENMGLGASLQHYNPLIDVETSKMFGLPASWKLMAQMPFGSIAAQPDDKTFLPLEDRVKVFK